MSDMDAQHRARQQLTIHVGLLLAMFVVHAFAASWLLAARLGMAFDPLALAPWRVARWAFEAWAIAGVVWAPLNARGLIQRRGWARRSAVWYWATSLAWCCCIPIPTWALWSLTRPAMKRLLDGPDATTDAS
jgi:hypothetical protein